MRIFALLLVMLLAAPLVARPVLAQAPAQHQAPGLSMPTMAQITDFRGATREALNKSRAFLAQVFSETQQATGVITNEQMFDVGVGAMAGLVLADVLATGGLATTFYALVGGVLGNWVASPAK